MKYRRYTLHSLFFSTQLAGIRILRSLERTAHLIPDVRDFTVFLFREQCFISANAFVIIKRQMARRGSALAAIRRFGVVTRASLEQKLINVVV